MTTLLKKFKKDLRNLADPQKACILQRFFKTGKGEYGEGDKFLGIIVPKQRALIKNYLELSLDDIANLLSSNWHEERLSALLLLVKQYQKSQAQHERKKIYDFYLTNTATINNWDLVDSSASYIVGHYLFTEKNMQNKTILHSLAKDSNLWLRRIAIVATHYFIRNNHYEETIALTKKLLNDKEDLIHKACGWMLREVGKRDVTTLKKFLQKHSQKMPRTMLRYAIEHFSPQEKQLYLLA